MSRKHYIEVAKILDDEPAHNAGALKERRRIAIELALMFKRDDPRFNAGKFFAAAGLPELTGTRMGLN